jgi:hypothetical protein
MVKFPSLLNKFLTFSGTRKFNYCVPSSPPFFAFLSHMISVHIFSWLYFRSILMLTSLLPVGFRSVLLRSDFTTRNTECVSLHFGACHMLRQSYTHHHDFLPVAEEIWILRPWWFSMNITSVFCVRH